VAIVRAAVIGHVEWVEFIPVRRVPRTGEIVHAAESWSEPAGGGGVSVVQLLKLTGEAVLFTALGDDDVGRLAHQELTRLGVRVEATFRPTPQRRAFTYLDAQGERTITTIGERLGPRLEDRLAWEELERIDAVYFTAGDVGALRAARRAGALVATARELSTLVAAGVPLDAVVGSARDPAERFELADVDPPPKLGVRTEGADGGTYETSAGERGRFTAAPLPGPPADSYGCGDSFAAGLTYALARGLDTKSVLALAARCGAACLTGRGAFEGQLTLAGASPP
jgi:ribokinase